MTEAAAAPLIPWSALVYGVAGVGKSYFAAQAPNPFFIDLENGLRRIKCTKTKSVLTSWAEVRPILEWAAGPDFKFKTLVIDTVSKLDGILAREVCERHGKPSLADFSYGKGEVYLETLWREVMDHVAAIVAAGRNVMLVGHDKIEKFQDPAGEDYDRYFLRLNKRAAPLVIEGVDAVLFATWQKMLRDKDKSDKQVAVNTQLRLLKTQDGAAWVAKNRMSLEPELEMAPAVFDLLAK